MKQLLKRATSLAMALVMCVMLLPVMELNAAAAGLSERFDAYVNNVRTTDEDDLEDELDDYTYVNIKLMNDWIMEDRLYVPKGRKVTLDLNGHVMSRNLTNNSEDTKMDGEVIFVGENATLTITDSNPQSQHSGEVYNGLWRFDRSGYTRISGGVITGGSGWDGAGGIHAKSGSTVTMYGGTIAGNLSKDGGGGIYSTGGRVELYGGDIAYNKVIDDYGGGIYIDGGRLEITKSHIYNNTVTGSYYGGGIYVSSGQERALNIHGSESGGVKSVQFEHNTAQYGGAIYVNSGKAPLIQNASFQYNEASKDGGAVYFDVENTIVSGSYFYSNTANGSGGAVYANQETISLANCTLKSNVAKTGNGGGIYFNDDNPTLSDCLIYDNRVNNQSSSVYGGGVYCDSDVDLQPLAISGKMEIYDNMDYYGRKSDLHIAGNNDLTVGTLEKGSRIGISVGSGSGYTGTGNPITQKGTNTKEDYFFSDYENLYVRRQEDPNSRNYRYLYLSSEQGYSAPTATVTSTAMTYVGDRYYPDHYYPVYKGYFQYPSVVSDKDYTSVFYYSDGFFANTSRGATPSLATMSLNLAMSAFGTNAGGTSDYTNKFAHVMQLLSDIGCEDIYVNDFFAEKPGTDSIGVAIAHKKLVLYLTGSTPSEYILVPIAIRGAGYESEWASNVTIGSAGEAKGFASAADQVTAEVQKYIAEHDLTEQATNGRVKFWVVGYSRAGATANLVGKRLTDLYDMERVYGYSFEPPQGAEEQENFDLHFNYRNLHCYLNPSDLVPHVAPSLMGFTHYGSEHALSPSVNYSDSFYMELRTEAIRQLAAINPEIQFEDYFHPATVNFLSSGFQDFLGIGWDLVTEKSWSGHETTKKWVPTLLEDLQKWSLNTGATQKDGGSNGDYRYFYSSKSDGILPSGSTKRTSMTFQDSIAELVPIVFGASAEEKEAIMDSMTGLANRIDKTKVWDDIFGDLHDISITKYDQWIDYFWTKLFEEPSAEEKAMGYSSLSGKIPAEKIQKIKAAWPTLAAVFFDFLNDDYNETGSMHLGTLMYNLDVIAQAHYPEVNLAWLRARDPLYIQGGSNAEITQYTLVDPAAPSDPVATINGAAPVQSYAGTQTLKLTSTPGAAIYYTVTTRIDGGTPITSGQQVYKGGIPLTYKNTSGNTFGSSVTTYTVTAYAKQYGKTSGEQTFTVQITNPARLLYVYTHDPNVPEYYIYNAGSKVTINAKPNRNQLFTEWTVNPSTAVIPEWDSVKNKEIATFTMPSETIEVRANYVGKIGNISLGSIAAPASGHDFRSTTSVTLNGHTLTPSIMWTVGDTPVSSSKAGYNTAYTANITLTQDEANQIYFADSVTATVGDEPATVYRNDADGSLVIRYTFPPTEKAKIKQVNAPTGIIAVPHGTSGETIVSKLPTQIEVVTDSGSIYCPVAWTVPDIASTPADQTVTVRGIVTFPSADDYNYNGKSNAINVSVSIAAADKLASPTASLAEGTYTTEQSLTLTAAPGASVYYTTDGSDPTVNGELYTGAITLDGKPDRSEKVWTVKAYAVPGDTDHNPSPVVTFTYTVDLPNIYKLTVKCSDPQGYNKVYTYDYVEDTQITQLPPVVADEKFDHWEYNGATSTDRAYSFQMPRQDVTLTAHYIPVVKAVEMTMTAPVAGQAMPSLTDCKVTVTGRHTITPDSFTLTWTPEPSDGKAAYNMVYTVKIALNDTITIIREDGTRLENVSSDTFEFADIIQAKVNGNDATLIKEDKEVYFTFPSTAAAMLTKVVSPAPLSINENGVSKDHITNQLPAEVKIEVVDKSVDSADVAWDDYDYDQNDLEAQEITVHGSIANRINQLVDLGLISNDLHVSTDVEQKIYVAAAPMAPMPTATPGSGDYVGTQTVTLYSGTDGATIYYTTDGSSPITSGTRKAYTGPITVSSDMTLSAYVAPSASTRMRNSGVSTYDYKITTPSYQLALITANGETTATYDLNASVTIDAKVPAGKVFAGWTAVRTDDPTDDVTQALGLDNSGVIATFSMPEYDVTVTASYQDKISQIDLTGITAPVAGSLFDTAAAVTLNGYDRAPDIVWTELASNTESVVSSNQAGFSKTYIANIVLTADSMKQIEFASENLTVTAKGEKDGNGVWQELTTAQDIAATYVRTNGSVLVRIKFQPTRKEAITAIEQPAAVTVPRGTSADAVKNSYLPNKVRVSTETGSFYAPVAWVVDAIPTAIAGRTIDVTGTVTLPQEYDTATHHISDSLTVSVTVTAAPMLAVPAVNLSGTMYEMAQQLELHGPVDAAIYYTTDGTDPRSIATSNLYEGPITLSGNDDHSEKVWVIKAFARKDGMQDSPVATFVYTIDRPDFNVSIHCRDLGTGKWDEPDTWAHDYPNTPYSGGQVSITAPYEVDEQFDHWENGAGTNLVNDTNRRSRTLALDLTDTEASPLGDIYLIAVYKPIVNAVTVTVSQPSAGHELAQAVGTCLVTITNTHDISGFMAVEWTPEESSGMAGYNRTYTAAISLDRQKLRAYAVDHNIGHDIDFAYADNATAQVNGNTATLNKADNKIYYTFEATSKASYSGVVDPSDISVPNGVSLNTIKSRLPSRIVINDVDGASHTVPVTWREISGYDPSRKEAQVLYVIGDFQLPDFMTDGEGQSLTVTQVVRVSAGTGDPTPPVTPVTPGGGSGSSSPTNSHTVTFNTNGGSVVSSIKKPDGTIIDLTQYRPTREGYTFAGWYSDKALTKPITLLELEKNTTVYAKWIKEETKPAGQMTFTDVKQTDWFYDSVKYVYERGMMNGISAEIFAPHRSTTRAMIVSILWRLEGCPTVDSSKRFSDVPSGMYYTEAVRWAASQNIVGGYADNSFRPNGNITREQFAAILYRYAQYKNYDTSANTDLSNFADGAQVGDWAAPAVQWACGVGLLKGNNGNLMPGQGATRCQSAALLTRFCTTVQ